MLKKKGTWSDMSFQRLRIARYAQDCSRYQGHGETFCGCGRMPEGMIEEVENQAKQRDVSSRLDIGKNRNADIMNMDTNILTTENQ